MVMVGAIARSEEEHCGLQVTAIYGHGPAMSSGNRRAFGIAVILSVAMHTVVACGFFLHFGSNATGFGGTNLDSVIVEIFASVPSEAQQASKAHPDDSDPPKPDATETVAVDPVATSEVASEVPIAPATRSQPPPPVEEQGSVAPAATAVSSTLAVEAEKRLSPGELEAFAQDVRLAIGRTPTNASGHHGQVVVSFGISKGGSVRFATITRSSGFETLDTAALDTIKRTSFPKSPDAMTDEQRTFTLPFDFRQGGNGASTTDCRNC